MLAQSAGYASTGPLADGEMERAAGWDSIDKLQTGKRWCPGDGHPFVFGDYLSDQGVDQQPLLTFRDSTRESIDP